MSRGPTPLPTHAAPATGLEDVTNGIRAVVDVEQRRLGALEDDEPLVVERAVQQRRRVGDVLLEPVAVQQQLLGHRLQVECRITLERAQHELLGLERGHDLLLEDLLVEHVLDADAQARGLVGVAGADPALGRPDLELPELRLARVVEHQVVGHDQVRVGAHPQVARRRRPRSLSPSISPISTDGSMTTPLPMTHVVPG